LIDYVSGVKDILMLFCTCSLTRDYMTALVLISCVSEPVLLNFLWFS